MGGDGASTHFEAVVPSVEVLKRDREFLSMRAAAEFAYRMEADRANRQVRALYGAALNEVLTKHGGLKLPDLLSRHAGLGSPHPMGSGGLGTGVGGFGPSGGPVGSGYSAGSAVIGSCGCPKNPSGAQLTGWVNLSPQVPGNYGIATGNFDGFRCLWLGVQAGGQSPFQGGTASACGYIGQYFTAFDFPQPSPPNPSGLVSVNVTCSPTLSYSPVWTATNILPFTWDPAVLTINVSFWIPGYDPQWNFIEAQSYSQTTVYSVDNYAGSGGGYYSAPSIWAQKLKTEFYVGSNYPNFGVFVEVSAYASASGAAEGGAIPGSNAATCIELTVPSIQVMGSVVAAS